jgi:hypothetical protein
MLRLYWKPRVARLTWESERTTWWRRCPWLVRSKAVPADREWSQARSEGWLLVVHERFRVASMLFSLWYVRVVVLEPSC